MKKLCIKSTAFLLAVCMSLTSCGSKESDSSSSEMTEEITAEKVSADETDEDALTDIFKPEKIKLPDDVSFIMNVGVFENGDAAAAYFSIDNTQNICLLTDGLSKSTELKLQFPDECFAGDEFYQYFTFMPDGTITAVCNILDNGGIKLPDDYDENFDYEAFEANQKAANLICTFDRSGNLLSKTEQFSLDDYKDEYGMATLSNVYPDGDSFIGQIASGESRVVVKINADGTLEELYSTADDSYIHNDFWVFPDVNGKICFMDNYFDNEHKNQVKYSRIDSESGKTEEIFSFTEEFTTEARPAFGRGEYLFFVPKIDALYGVKADNTLESVLDWNNADIQASMSYPYGENEFLSVMREENDWSLVHLRRLRQSEADSFKEVTIASVGSDSAAILAAEFNRSDTDCHVKIINYAEYDENNEYDRKKSWEKLSLDIINGDAPDIMIFEDFGDMKRLADKGAFADMYELMEDDDEVNRATVMPNILKAGEGKDGGLYILGDSFDVYTVAVKEKYGQSESWTINEMLDFFDSAEGASDSIYKYHAKEEFFTDYFSWTDSIIDIEKGKCDFDCDEYVRFLELCNKFPNEVDVPDKETEYEAFSQFYTDMYYSFSLDKDPVNYPRFSSDSHYSTLTDIDAKSELTLVGFPSDDRCGGRIELRNPVAINADCKDKEAAWQFVRSLFTLERQGEKSESGSYMIYGYSARREIFERQMEDEMHFYDFDGNEVECYESKGESYYPLTKEEGMWLSDYIMNSYRIKDSYDIDLYSICLEEAQAYFSGEHTASEAAEYTQNRASILISERS